MKKKYKIGIIILSVLLVTAFISYNRLHYVYFNGLCIKLPFITKQYVNGKTIHIRAIPFDGTSLSITNSNIDYNNFLNLYKKVKGEYLIDNKQILSTYGLVINIQVVGIDNSSQLKTVYGYIKDQPFYFTITGISNNIDGILKSLDSAKIGKP